MTDALPTNVTSVRGHARARLAQTDLQRRQAAGAWPRSSGMKTCQVSFQRPGFRSKTINDIRHWSPDANRHTLRARRRRVRPHWIWACGARHSMLVVRPAAHRLN
ncbi:MAG TPA: hypothetical protein VI793_16855 [Anaerolineales bacterium]|nr:hypothetical protein [Anaerolineales bacterium]